MVMIMETIIDEYYLYKSTTSIGITTRSKQDVDGMDGDGGDAAVDDEDRCLSLSDLRRAEMDPLWMSSPFRCLPKVRFLRFLGVLYVVSLIQLHGVKLFEEAVVAPTIQRELYDRNFIPAI